MVLWERLREGWDLVWVGFRFAVDEFLVGLGFGFFEVGFVI